MKTRLALGLLLTLTLGSALARADVFPGLKVVMTAEDYARAGLDKLTPDQIGVIDAALIRHFTATVNVAAERQAATQVDAATTQAVASERKRGVLQRFGILSLNNDWKNEPVLKARATGWVGGNRFALDNGQVWEGAEPIPFELAGRDVEIQPRPAGAFALSIEGKNTTIRVRRVK
ncbi:MAG: hypothetical protein H7343_02225 [Undibacterium sp.]|nr:hypothetical protein [Opitutaceae bacterium]